MPVSEAEASALVQEMADEQLTSELSGPLAATEVGELVETETRTEVVANEVAPHEGREPLVEVAASEAHVPEEVASDVAVPADPFEALFAESMEALVAGLPRLGGAWLLGATDEDDDRGSDAAQGWRLWLAHQAGERIFQRYPAESKLAADGAGGVWILGPESIGDAGDAHWTLWHANQEGERSLYRYPAESRLAGDGQGGVWLLCETADENEGGEDPDWCLWHASESEEHRLYTYPRDSQLASDGQGGIWILCETERGSGSIASAGAAAAPLFRLWHATASAERALHSFPGDAKLSGDGRGGVWVLGAPLVADAGEAAPNADWSLWHVAQVEKRCLLQYPAGSRIQGDGQGGVWILCETTDEEGDGSEGSDGDWCLWHTKPDGAEICLYRYPKETKIAGDGLGGVWLLCETTDSTDGEEASRCLWHATKEGERNLYEYPSNAKLATT